MGDPVVKKTASAIAVCAVLSILVAYLFSVTGPISIHFSRDLSFIVLPIVGFLVLRLARKLTLILMPSYGGRILAANRIAPGSGAGYGSSPLAVHRLLTTSGGWNGPRDSRSPGQV